MRKVTSGGGWPAIWYTLSKARQSGGLWKMYKALRTRNTCKTCALGMGGQKGGMVNEVGRFPEVCKKSLQAMAADMQAGIPEDFWNLRTVAALRSMSPRQLEASGRLVTPVILRRGEQRYQPISWEQALTLVAERLRSLPADQTFWYFSGRSSNEAGFLLQLFARLYGTNNVNNCSYYCHQASGVGLSSSIGSGTATIVLEDLHQADLVFLIGGNPSSNHPRLMTSLVRVRRRGGRVVVINPVVETGLVRFRIPSDVRSLLFGSRIASTYVQPHIGGDLALLTGIAKRVVEMNGHDPAFLSDHCRDSEAYLSYLAAQPWEALETGSGVDRRQIDELAQQYIAARNVVFSWTMGITHHAHGVHNVQAIANLALLRGMVGRPAAGLMPIRGHSNVQGIGSVGVTPKLKDAIFDRLQSHFGVQLPTTAGKDTLACIEAADAGQLRLGFCLGGNLYGSNPDSQFAGQALGKLDMLVYMNTTLNTGHAHGVADTTLILPVLARDEEPQPTTQESMFNFVRLSDGGPRRHDGPRSEVQVIADLAGRVLGSDGPLDWQRMSDTGQIRQAIAQVVPGFEQLQNIDQSKQEFHIAGRTLHQPQFPTSDGRAVLHAHRLPALPGGSGRLRLMTVRSEGQFNTVVYEDHDLYRGQDRRDVVLVHSQDIQQLGLRADQPVRVRSSTGCLEPILVRRFDAIKPGNALMYYPEANGLVPRTADALSRTPAFKGVVITLESLTHD